MAANKEAATPRKPLLLDPAAVTISPANARCDTPFDLEKNKALIENIRNHGQTIPVPVRSLADGRYEVLAGTRRLGAVRFLQKTDKGLTLKAYLVEADDRAAWRIAYSENEDRKSVTAFQTARAWQYALDNLCGGVQDKLAAAVQKDKSTVSHTLALLSIPDEVRFALRDPETISVNFGSKLLQALKSGRREAMIEKAEEISSRGKCSPDFLLRALLEVDGRGTASGEVKLWSEPGRAVLSRSGKGAHVLTIQPLGAETNQETRRALLQEIEAKLAAALELTDEAPVMD
ncbi:MAG TPA: ParB/RepB/Spo0J family partition protein [Allosphingosinicella sp.]|jgi:ParB family chromosome partitioning protein